MSTEISHITNVTNLQSILAKRGLVSTNALREAKTKYSSIAYEEIQDRRTDTQVPCALGGVLHDYVPFYFAPRSPMLFTISRGNVPSCPGQDQVIHLVSTAEQVQEADLGFAFTDGHGIMLLTEFFDDLDDLDQVDWSLMKDKYWRDTQEDGDRKRRRQAEFLVYRFMPWRLISEIAVMTKVVARTVTECLERAADSTPVSIKPKWYC